MMERLGVPISQASRFGWHNVCVWANHLGQGSHVFEYKHPEEAAYASNLHIAAMLADLYDLYAAANYGKDAQKLKYPRPWDKDRLHIGRKRDAIPISEFDKWYNGGE